jgi:hypothetical protein
MLTRDMLTRYAHYTNTLKISELEAIGDDGKKQKKMHRTLRTRRKGSQEEAAELVVSVFALHDRVHHLV